MESAEFKWDIIYPTDDYTDDLARFNTEMAWETEKKKLVPEIITAGVKSLIEQPKYGKYLTAVQDNKALGSLLTTFEYNAPLSRQIYWIQSVFVEPEFRGKGIFKSLFKRAIQKARDNHAYSVKLYVEKANERAKEVYLKLGMSNNNQEVFEMDFAFGDHKFNVPEVLLNKGLRASKITQDDLKELSEIKTKHLLGTISQDALNLEALTHLVNHEVAGDVIVIREGEHIVGVVSAFPEWSDWRNKVTQWVYDIKISDKVSQNDYSQYMKLFIKLAFDELDKQSMGAYRINFKDGNDELKKALAELGLEESHYYIFEILTS